MSPTFDFLWVQVFHFSFPLFFLLFFLSQCPSVRRKTRSLGGPISIWEVYFKLPNALWCASVSEQKRVFVCFQSIKVPVKW